MTATENSPTYDRSVDDNVYDSPSVAAIVIAFQPNIHQLAKLLRLIAPQVRMGCIIHNGTHLEVNEMQLELSGFTVVHLGSNLGVASALNAGFLWAQSMQAKYIISFDQDSEPARDMVERLLCAYSALAQIGHKVGALGPQQVDKQTGKPVPFIEPISSTRRLLFPKTGEALEVDHLISSGCLVPLQAWNDSGGFLDALFIDYVDIEWCLRLRSKGWKLFGVGGANLIHSIGEGARRVGSRQVAWHRPQRHYYVFRNGVYLQKLPYISLGWKLSDAWHLTKKFIFFSLAARPRVPHMRAMLAGMLDGWNGQLGRSSSKFE